MSYVEHFKNTPQSEPLTPNQIPNSAGGYSFAVDDWMRLNRFLILGNEGGSYYATERKLTLSNAAVVERLLKVNGPKVVQTIVEISDAGRAPKNDPAILALALAAKKGDDITRKLALDALPKVCRIGTHIMHFAEYVQAFGGWGRGTRRAVGDWYAKRSPHSLAHQAIKYQSRDGWSNRDLLRLSHPKAPSKEHAAIFNWIVKGEGPKEQWTHGSAVETVWAFDELKKLALVKDGNVVQRAVKLITEYMLPRECVPTELLNHVEIWEALLPHMKPEALVRNLAKMTAVGLLAPLSDATRKVTEKLSDWETLREARLHPIKVLTAQLTYGSGHGVKGSLTWTPVQSIMTALDDAFYKTFRNVEPTGKRWLLGLDISGSMDDGVVAGVPGLTPRIASAAMSLVTAAVEEQHHFIGFTAGPPSAGSRYWERSNGVTEIDISPRQRLVDVVRTMQGLQMGGTDCSLPMRWALEKKIPVDVFVVYTDSETWAGEVHASKALRDYRQKMGIGAKLIVVGMLANEFSIADPNDGGMMDVVGFDTAAPAIMSDFAKQ